MENINLICIGKTLLTPCVIYALNDPVLMIQRISEKPVSFIRGSFYAVGIRLIVPLQVI